ncbi:MAG: hypothetical protein AAF591_22590 [Verrucomicrobiota bacterium]
MNYFIPISQLTTAVLVSMMLSCQPGSGDDSLDPEERTEILLFLKDRLPEHHREFEQEQAEEILEGAMGIREEWESLRAREPEAASAFLILLGLEARATNVADRLVLSEDRMEKEALSEELRGLLAQQFDARLVFESGKINVIEAEIAAFKQQHFREKERRVQVLAEDFESILEDSRRDLGR